MIRLLHTADWHLGKMFFGRSMLEDQKYFFDNYFFPTLEDLRFGCSDCVVLAGDIFDRAVPPVAALELFDNVITRLSQMGIRLFAVTGNHDGAARLSIGARLMRRAGIFLYTSLADSAESLVLDDSDGFRAVLHPLPHFDISQGRAFINDEECVKYCDCYSRIISGIDLSDSAAAHILVSHCTAFPDSWKNNSGDDGGRAVGGSDEIDIRSLDPFSLTLLGHFHSDVSVSDKAAYCGSPLGYSFDRANTVRSMRLYELGRDGINMRKITVDKPLHPLRTVSGSFERLLSDNTPPSGDYIYALLDDATLIYEPMSKLREKFPNILGLRYSSETSGGLSSGYRDRLRDSLRSRSVGDSEVFEIFLRQICGTEPSSEDLDMFAQLCRDAFSTEEES